MDDNAPSLFDETCEYLAEAQARIDKLPPVPPLDPERVPPPPAIETITPRDQQKVRRLSRRYGGNVPADMVRHPDHGTSIEAAERVLPGLSELQQIIYECFLTHGAMTDEQLEQLPTIVRLDLGPTTARRRRTDLCKMEKLVIVGEAVNARGNKMNVYDVPGVSRERHGYKAWCDCANCLHIRRSLTPPPT